MPSSKSEVASQERGAQDAGVAEGSAVSTGIMSRPLDDPTDSFNSQGKGGVATTRELDYVNEGLRRLRVMEKNNEMLRQRI